MLYEVITDLIVDTLSTVLEIDKEMILDKSDNQSQYEILKRQVEKPEADKIITFKKENELSCIGCDPDTNRITSYNVCYTKLLRNGFTFECQAFLKIILRQ